MAIHLVLGNIKGGHAVLDTNFSSSPLAHGTLYTVAEASKNYLIVTSAENAYIAFSNTESDPNPATEPRYLLAANVPAVFSVVKGTKLKSVAV